MKKVLFLASGSGSNVENIYEYFFQKRMNLDFQIVCNKKDAGIFDRAERLNLPINFFSKADFTNGAFAEFVKNYNPDLIVLAGFLLMFPEDVVQMFPNKIINVHPALLPKYGGKGMYGMNVHRAVLENEEPFTGITIHYVNEHYDEGEVILQVQTDITTCATAEEIAEKVHQLEYEHFPKVIHSLL